MTPIPPSPPTVAPEPTVVDRAWFLATHPLTLGGILMSAGVLLMVSTLTALPGRFDPAWWTEAMAPPEAMLFCILGVVLVATLGLGALVHLWRTSTQEDFEILGLTGPLAQPKRAVWHLVPWVGAGLMGLGVVGVLGLWISLQRQNPPAQVAIPTGGPVEQVWAPVAGQQVRVMLPKRVEITALDAASAQKSVTLRVMRPAQTDAPTQSLRPGETVEFDGVRLGFLGVTQSADRIQGIFQGTTAQSITVPGLKGDTIKVALDAPGYTIEELTPNYLGSLGPAAKLAPQPTGPGDTPQDPFWVFLRASEDAPTWSTAHPITLLRIQAAPAALFTLAPVVPFEPLAGFMLCFALGLGLFLVFPDMRSLGRGRFASINDAGPLAQSVWASAVKPQDESVAPKPVQQQEEE